MTLRKSLVQTDESKQEKWTERSRKTEQRKHTSKCDAINGKTIREEEEKVFSFLTMNLKLYNLADLIN